MNKLCKHTLEMKGRQERKERRKDIQNGQSLRLSLSFSDGKYFGQNFLSDDPETTSPSEKIGSTVPFVTISILVLVSSQILPCKGTWTLQLHLPVKTFHSTPTFILLLFETLIVLILLLTMSLFSPVRFQDLSSLTTTRLKIHRKPYVTSTNTFL